MPLVEYEAVACRCDEPLPAVCLEEIIPEALLKGSERACELIVAAGSDPDRTRRLLLRAATVAKRLAHRAKQLRRHELLSFDCGTALTERYAELRTVARDYAHSLPRRP